MLHLRIRGSLIPLVILCFGKHIEHSGDVFTGPRGAPMWFLYAKMLRAANPPSIQNLQLWNGYMLCGFFSQCPLGREAWLKRIQSFRVKLEGAEQSKSMQQVAEVTVQGEGHARSVNSMYKNLLSYWAFYSGSRRIPLLRMRGFAAQKARSSDVIFSQTLWQLFAKEAAPWNDADCCKGGRGGQREA